MSLMRLMVKVGIDATDYMVGLKKIDSTLVSIGKAAAAAFTVGAVTNWTMKIANAIASISDLADQLELTTDQVQALQHAAAGSGVAFDAYANAINKIRKAQADFRAGDQKMGKLFERLGVNPNIPAYDALKQMGFTDDKAALFELLGVRSARLFESLKEIKDLSPIELIPESTIRSLDWAMDSFLKTSMQALAVSIKIAAVFAGINAAPGMARDVALGMLREKLFGAKPATEPEERGQGWTPHVESITRTPFPEGYTKSGRSSGWAGPRQLVKGFSPVDLGDRANVGGFFGPNADVNRKMQQNIESMNNEIKAISKVVVSTAQTAP